jgi:hypothetical protein
MDFKSFSFLIYQKRILSKPIDINLVKSYGTKRMCVIDRSAIARDNNSIEPL